MFALIALALASGQTVNRSAVEHSVKNLAIYEFTYAACSHLIPMREPIDDVALAAPIKTLLTKARSDGKTFLIEQRPTVEQCSAIASEMVKER